MSFLNQRLSARRRFLSTKDLGCFQKVPVHIVDAFFGECSYLKRMQVVTFCFLNGISEENSWKLIFWKNPSLSECGKVSDLFKMFEIPENRSFSGWINKILLKTSISL